MPPKTPAKADTLPPLLRKMSKEKQAVALAYETKTKLAAVIRWRVRMAACGLTGLQVGKGAGLYNTRVSEFLNFSKEPNESDFHKIEAFIYKEEAKLQK